MVCITFSSKEGLGSHESSNLKSFEVFTYITFPYYTFLYFVEQDPEATVKLLITLASLTSKYTDLRQA